jgi:subtilisin family serine protease
MPANTMQGWWQHECFRVHYCHPTPTTYELAPDQVLIQVAKDADERKLESFLDANSFKMKEQPAHIRRAKITLEPAKLRWITLPPQFTSAESAETALKDSADVVDVRPIYYESGGGPETAATPIFDRLLIRINKDQQRNALATIEDLGLKHNAQMSQLLEPYHLFKVPTAEGQTVAERGQEMAEKVAAVAGVVSVEFDWLKLETYQVIPNDSHYGNQWNMPIISAENAWDIEHGVMEVLVAILDSGFDLGHPDLNFTPNTASNPTHFNAEDAENGDVPPYNAGPSGVPHGTAVAGIAAATFNNNRGVAGVAGGCRIMPVRLGTTPSASLVAAGLRWAADHGAHVANMSLGTSATAAAINAVVYAAGKGVVLCAATGNSGGNTTSPAINFPARHADTIAVGASNEDDERKRPASNDGEWWWGSQFGSEIDVVAPGVHIWTTDERGTDGYNTSGDYYDSFNGTSAATPHVTGLAALIRSANRTLTRRQVCDIIKSNCDKISPDLYTFARVADHPNGTWNEEVGYGRINASKAITAASARTQAVCIATNSDFAVVWEGDPDRNGLYQIKARGFRENGTEHFKTFTVNTVGSGQQIKPAAAMASDGRFVVVWEDDADRNGYYQIKARGFNADGSERFHDMTVNSTAKGQQLKPAVAMASDGRFVVVWEDDKDGNGYYQIKARGFNADGSERFHDMTVNNVSKGQQLKPAVAMASDARFVVAWQDDEDEDSFYQAFARGFNANGTANFGDLKVQ